MFIVVWTVMGRRGKVVFMVAWLVWTFVTGFFRSETDKKNTMLFFYFTYILRGKNPKQKAPLNSSSRESRLMNQSSRLEPICRLNFPEWGTARFHWRWTMLKYWRVLKSFPTGTCCLLKGKLYNWGKETIRISMIYWILVQNWHWFQGTLRSIVALQLNWGLKKVKWLIEFWLKSNSQWLQWVYELILQLFPQFWEYNWERFWGIERMATWVPWPVGEGYWVRKAKWKPLELSLPAKIVI